MFGPRARALARPIIANARSYATRPSPSTPPAAAGSIGGKLLVGATAISIFGLIASQRDSARMEAERQAKKVPRTEKPSSSPAPDIVQKKEAEAIAETRQAESSHVADIPTGHEGEEQAAPAKSQGAFNEETGEINWDCPCLGGMADGPCGEDFKAAFSCFVYSEAEPKGVDCVEKFRAMQDCFRLHPDIYGEEIDDDEDEAPAAAAANISTTEEVAAPSGKEDIGAVDSIPPVAAVPTETA